MTERFDEELVKNLNQAFFEVFRLLEEHEEERLRGELEKIRSAVHNPSTVKMTILVEY